MKPSINCTWAQIFTKKNHFVIPMKQNFEILFYILAKMPTAHLKLIFFNKWIDNISNSLINTNDI
jgi:hypothetical protein